MKTFFIISNFVFLIPALGLRAQIEFREVKQTVDLLRPPADSNFTFNFQYLSYSQFSDLSKFFSSMLNANRLKTPLTDDGEYRKSKKSDRLYSYDVTYPDDTLNFYSNAGLREKLVFRPDSVEVINFDDLGNEIVMKVAGPIDSTWFMDNLTSITFHEKWIFDSVNFTLRTIGRSYVANIRYKGKEDLNPYPMFRVIHGPAANTLPVTDFIITDVYCKHDPITYDQFEVDGTNTGMDLYMNMRFINCVIDRIRSKKIRCYRPTLPFRDPLNKKDLEPFFTTEFSSNKHENYPVRYKSFCYRYKLVQTWQFDPVNMSFKKENLGIILMRKKEQADLVMDANSGGIRYTFEPIVFVQFAK